MAEILISGTDFSQRAFCTLRGNPGSNFFLFWTFRPKSLSYPSEGFPREGWRDRAEDLDVDLSFKAKQNSNKFNKGGYYKKNFFTKIIFQPSIFKNLLKRVIKPTPLLKILLAWTASIFSIKAEQIDKETEIYLKKYFKEEVAKLKSLNVDVSNWRKY